MAENHGVKYPYWQEVVDRQADSGLSIRAFCREEGISEQTFYSWRRKLGDGGVAGRGDDSSNGDEFVPLTWIGNPEPVEVVHPLGYRVRISGDVDVVALNRILDVLDGRADQ